MWEEMPLPGEVVQISCGPAELVWAVLWEGQFIVREGISRDCPKGKESAGPGGCGDAFSTSVFSVFRKYAYGSRQVPPGQ